LPDVFGKNTKTGKICQNDHKIYQMALKYTKLQENRRNVLKIYQRLSMQDTSKFTQTDILGFKVYHLATPDAMTPTNLAARAREQKLDRCKKVKTVKKKFSQMSESD
jgi:hypothetical protein